MKLELERQSFLKAWQTAEKSAGTKTPKDVISGILVKADENGNVTLEATDLKSSVKCKANGVKVIEPGTAVLSLNIFGNLLKKTTEENITLDVNSERGLLIYGKSKIRFAIFNVDEFPRLPDSAESELVCEIMCADLIRLISEGTAASSQPQDFPKYLGTCLFRTSESEIKSVSTDGKRLALSKMICNVTKSQDLLLPAPALRELGKMLSSGNGDETVKISCDTSTAWFALPEIEYSIRLIDSTFPNYERILNNETRTTLRISRDKLLAVIDRIDIIARMTPAHIMALELKPGEELIITARAPDAGTAREFLEAGIEGGYMQIGFNVSYFQDGLRALGSGDIVIEFSHEEGQCRMTRSESDDFLYMLMPARLSSQDTISDDEISDFVPENQENVTSL
ncbi:MAG: DNA polymerase III subunit beta [Synergistaceae bacterium]|nr:DNA polymerase III subunit beta [Synergistaceae bacterium]